MSPHPRGPVAPTLVLLALASGAFAIGASQAGAGGIEIEQAKDLGTSVDLVGYSISAYALGVVVSAPLLTILLARWDRRKILLAMMAIAVVFNAATALAPGVGALIAIRFFSAIPHGVFLAAGSVVGAHVVGAKRRGRAMAVMMTGFTVAIIAAVPMMKWVAATYDWRWTYLGVSAASAIALALVFAVVPSVPAVGPSHWRTDLAHLRQRKVAGAILFCGLGFAGFGVVFTYVVPILQELDKLSVNAVTVVLSASGVAMTVGTIIAGKITDLSPVLSAKVGAVLSVAGLVALGLGGAVPAIAIAIVLLVNGAAALMSQGAQTHFMDVIHASPMLGAAMAHASLNVANAIGAAVGAAIIGAHLGYLTTAWVAVGFTVIGIGILAWGPGFRRAGAALA